MKTNLNITNGLSSKENNYYISEIEEERYCFTKTGELKYIDFYDTHKNSVLEHLRLNGGIIINKVAGFKSLTKTFTTIPEGYGISKYVEIENGDVYVLIHKYELKDGVTKEMLQKDINHAWKNNRSLSTEHFMVRVD